MSGAKTVAFGGTQGAHFDFQWACPDLLLEQAQLGIGSAKVDGRVHPVEFTKVLLLGE